MPATSFTSNSKTSLHLTAARQLLVVAVATAALLAVGQAINEAVPHDVNPGWTPAELRDRLALVNWQKDVVVIGDSRVGWGIADKIVTQHLRTGGIDTTVHNLGIAAGGYRKIMKRLEHVGPSKALLVVSCTPAFLYAFDAGPDDNKDHVRSENFLEGRFNEFAKSYLSVSPSILLNDIKKLVHPTRTVFWAHRTVYPEGFVNAVLSSSDGTPVNSAQYQLNYYSEIFHNIEEHLEKARFAREDFLGTVGKLRSNGWQILLVRLPVGREMLLRKMRCRLSSDLNRWRQH